MRNLHKVVFAAILLLILALPEAAFAAQQPPAEWKDSGRVLGRDNPITKIVKIIKRIIVVLDEPQAPPPK
jgi:hypothetical protein